MYLIIEILGNFVAMKKQRIQLITIISTFIFLIVLVFIQVNWIFQTARMKKDLFDKSVNMALSQAVDNISRDFHICENVRSCFVQDSSGSCCQGFSKIEWKKVNRIIRQDLEDCNIDLDFEFDIIDMKKNIRLCDVKEITDKPYYSRSLEDALQKSGVLLTVKFPDINQFRISQIGPMFITAIILIILVMISFIMTLNYYIKEKKIAERTRDFINNMTHEFKTPLANIAFANNMLAKKESTVLSEKAKKYLGIIRDENVKLQGQVDELLQISELGNTDIVNNVENLDIHQVIEEAVKSLDVQIEESGGIIRRNFEAQNSYLKLNKTHLKNLITNLVDNSNKYSDRKPDITIKTYNDERNLIVEVVDKGIGINSEHLDHIFDKFYRAPDGDISYARGFGLGLTYVKMVMDAIGGEIEVESTPGKGSMFRLIIPQPESFNK